MKPLWQEKKSLFSVLVVTEVCQHLWELQWCMYEHQACVMRLPATSSVDCLQPEMMGRTRQQDFWGFNYGFISKMGKGQ